MAPLSRNGGREPGRGPKSRDRWKGSGCCPTSRLGCPTAGSLGCPLAGPQQAPDPSDSEDWARAQTEGGPGPIPHTSRSPPCPQGRSWSPGLSARPGPRPHSPTSVREARPPHLGGAHPKPPPLRPLVFGGGGRKRKKKKREERKQPLLLYSF